MQDNLIERIKILKKGQDVFVSQLEYFEVYFNCTRCNTIYYQAYKCNEYSDGNYTSNCPCCARLNYSDDIKSRNVEKFYQSLKK